MTKRRRAGLGCGALALGAATLVWFLAGARDETPAAAVPEVKRVASPQSEEPLQVADVAVRVEQQGALTEPAPTAGEPSAALEREVLVRVVAEDGTPRPGILVVVASLERFDRAFAVRGDDGLWHGLEDSFEHAFRPTDAEGRVTFMIRAADFSIGANVGNLATAGLDSTGWDCRGDPSPRIEQTLVIQPTDRSLSVRVTDDLGNPVEGIGVSVGGGSALGGSSDSSGLLVFSGLRRRQHSITVDRRSIEGRYEEPRGLPRVDLSGDSSHVAIVLTRLGAAALRADEPAPTTDAIDFFVERVGDRNSWILVATTQASRAAGDGHVIVLPRGDYVAIARFGPDSDRHSPRAVSFSVAPGEVARVVVPAEISTLLLGGRVLDARGVPVPGVRVSAIARIDPGDPRSGAPWSKAATTEADGTFRIAGAPAARFNLSVDPRQSPAGRFAHYNAEPASPYFYPAPYFVETPRTDLEFVVADGFEIRGSIRSRQHPPLSEEVEVRIAPTSKKKVKQSLPIRSERGDDGEDRKTFVADSLAAGTYRLWLVDSRGDVVGTGIEVEVGPRFGKEGVVEVDLGDERK